MSEQDSNTSNPTNTMDETFNDLNKEWMDANDKKDQARIDTVVSKLEKLASEGHGKSIYLLGVIFNDADNAHHDEIRAFEYFERAAKLNIPAAFLNLSQAYFDKKKYEKAFQLAQQGAELGDVECMRRLGIQLIEGLGTADDGLLGIRWVKKAADAGNTDAQYDYARQLIKGVLIKADLPKAIEILEKVCKDTPGVNAAWELSCAYQQQSDKEGNSSSKKKADEWARIAADFGHEEAKKMFADAKFNDQWNSLKDFTIGDERYSFFYKDGKVEDTRTESRSSTYSTGSGQSARIATSHISWQEIDLRDNAGNKFKVQPDSELVISTGSEVDVLYICKGGEDTGYPVIMVDRNSGEQYVIQSTKEARSQLGYKNKMAKGCLISMLVFFVIIGFWILGSVNGPFNKLIVLAFIAPFVIGIVKLGDAPPTNLEITALNDHIIKISNFLRQKQ